MKRLRKKSGKEFHLQKTQNKIKCPVFNLAKKMKVLYNENAKTLKEEIEEDNKIWKDFPCS
jgi:hypothetical protein